MGLPELKQYVVIGICPQEVGAIHKKRGRNMEGGNRVHVLVHDQKENIIENAEDIVETLGKWIIIKKG